MWKLRVLADFKKDTDVLYFKQGRTPVVVLNTVNAAEELLSKRGANYSDRPRFVLFEVYASVCATAFPSH